MPPNDIESFIVEALIEIFIKLYTFVVLWAYYAYRKCNVNVNIRVARCAIV
jgi:hypothetical protein